MERRGLNGGTFTTGQGYTAGTFGMIDNLTYSINDKNQLTTITEASLLNKGFKKVNQQFGVTSTPSNYTYDTNGNMISDQSKSIVNIEYNYLNLPQKILFIQNNCDITFIYDASGVKLRKLVNQYGTISTYDYVNGVEYKNKSLERISNTEGAVTKNINGVFEYEYALRDHLGNTRATFKDKNSDGTVRDTDIVQINHYYPFGLNMEGNWTPKGANGEGNKYQYNGKELNEDFGLNWNDYGARFYDAAIGRFSTKDRFAEKYVVVNPYQYAANNPIRFIDVNGDSLDVFGVDGNFMYTFDNGSGTSTTGGIKFNKSRTNKDGSVTYSDPIAFGYNDPYEDHKSVAQDGFGVEIVSDKTIEGMIDKSGVRSSEAQNNPTDYASREGRPKGNSSHHTLGLGKKGDGKMDYYQQNPDNIKSNTLHIITQNGQAAAYNPKDFGNYMWGYGMKILGFSLSQSQMAAHGNNFLSGGRTDGGERTYLDSYGDQRAIQDGHNRGTNANPTNGVETHTYWTAQAKKQ